MLQGKRAFKVCSMATSLPLRLNKSQREDKTFSGFLGFRNNPYGLFQGYFAGYCQTSEGPSVNPVSLKCLAATLVKSVFSGGSKFPWHNRAAVASNYNWLF
eukprot:scaffold79356_cov22-Tisochrysis_lutea.AAC.1